MYFVKQLITGFTSSNLTETYPAWSSTTTYIFQSSSPTSSSIARDGSWYYRSLVDNNLNFQPTVYEGKKWSKYAVANSHAMLDAKAQTRSVLVGGDISVTFDIGFRWDVIGVGNYEGENVTIELLDASNTALWTYTTASTYSQNVANWYTWTFSPRTYDAGKSIAVKIPKYIGATKCKVTINRFTEATQTSCGFLVGGVSQWMGDTLSDLAFDYNSYTKRNVDDFGNVEVIRRAVEDGVDFKTSINKAIFLQKQREIKVDLDSNLMFVIDDVNDESSIVLYGMMSKPTLLYDEFEKSVINWTITELV